MIQIKSCGYKEKDFKVFAEIIRAGMSQIPKETLMDSPRLNYDIDNLLYFLDTHFDKKK